MPRYPTLPRDLFCLDLPGTKPAVFPVYQPKVLPSPPFHTMGGWFYIDADGRVIRCTKQTPPPSDWSFVYKAPSYAQIRKSFANLPYRCKPLSKKRAASIKMQEKIAMEEFFLPGIEKSQRKQNRARSAAKLRLQRTAQQNRKKARKEGKELGGLFEPNFDGDQNRNDSYLAILKEERSKLGLPDPAIRPPVPDQKQIHSDEEFEFDVSPEKGMPAPAKVQAARKSSETLLPVIRSSGKEKRRNKRRGSMDFCYLDIPSSGSEDTAFCEAIERCLNSCNVELHSENAGDSDDSTCDGYASDEYLPLSSLAFSS